MTATKQPAKPDTGKKQGERANVAARISQSFLEDMLTVWNEPNEDGAPMRTYAGVMKGTKFGAMVTPGSPDTSNLAWLLDWKASPELRMPHGKTKLSSCDRDAIREWIRQGAKDN